MAQAVTAHSTIPSEFSQIATICTATEVEIGGQTMFGIADARDLHKGLKVGRDYATWIRARIARYGFREGEDYQIIDPPNRGNQTGRGGDRRSQAYTLSLDMAKELSMVENNEQGRLVRRYFIWADNQRRQEVAPSIPVRAHTRRRPDTSLRNILPSTASGHGAIILNGEIITYDTADYDVMRGDVVLVILSNGEIEVNEVGGQHGAQIRETQEFGPRTIGSAHRIMTAMRRGEVRHLPVRYCGMIIGRVIDRKPVQKAA